MVTSCPSDYTDELISSKCNQMAQPYTYHLDVAVQSSVTNLTYANWFCAFCNSDIEGLLPLQGDITCNNLDIIDDCSLDASTDILIDENYHAGQLRQVSVLKIGFIMARLKLGFNPGEGRMGS